MRASKKMRSRTGIPAMAMGLLLIAAALILTGYNLWDERRADAAAREVLGQMTAQDAQKGGTDGNVSEAPETAIPDDTFDPGMEMPEVEIDGNTYIGTLTIPSLDLSLPVMSEWSEEKLKTAPCRYSGSVYQDNLVIAGHSYRYHFRPIRDLTPGAEVVFTDTEGHRFRYEAAESQILKPDAVEEMTESDWDLTLFTCTFDSRFRYTLRCRRVKTKNPE